MFFKLFADPSSLIRILHSAFTWANQMKSEAWRRFTKAQADNRGKNISQNCDSGEAVHPSNLCFFLLIWPEQVRFLVHSSMAKVVSVVPKASGLGQPSTQVDQFKICAQQKLQHTRQEFIQALGTHGPFSPTIWLVCPSYCSASKISAWFFFSREHDATTQFQLILDIVLDSLQ